jgi:hypothetical protein
MMPSPPSTRPSDARGRRSSRFDPKNSTTATGSIPMRVSVSRGATGSVRGNSTAEAVRVLHAGRRGWSDAVHGGAGVVRARPGDYAGLARRERLTASWLLAPLDRAPALRAVALDRRCPLHYLVAASALEERDRQPPA